MKAEVSRVIRSSIDIRAKEELVIGFINDTDLQKIERPWRDYQCFLRIW